MDKFGALNLLELSELEQTLATGKTEEGTSPKLDTLIESVEQMMETLKKPIDKLRLLLILIVSKNGLNDPDKERLWDAAKVTPDQQKVFDNIRNYLDINLIQTEETATQNKGMLGGWLG